MLVRKSEGGGYDIATVKEHKDGSVSFYQGGYDEDKEAIICFHVERDKLNGYLRDNVKPEKFTNYEDLYLWEERQTVVE